jgi:hypothetical protein
VSLDVYLTMKGSNVALAGTGVFVREGGQTRELTVAEVQERFPECELVADTRNEDSDGVYWANITHNLNKMAEAAGLYVYLWRPDEHNIQTANQLIEPLRQGLKKLRANRMIFESYNPENGWGSYEALVEFVEKYLAACEKYPQALVSVSR